MLDPYEVAWGAGLFEGEGSLFPNAGSVRLVVKMTDRDVVERFARLIGAPLLGPYQYQQKDGHVRKPYWMCARSGVQAVAWINRFWSYLGERRRLRALELGFRPHDG